MKGHLYRWKGTCTGREWPTMREKREIERDNCKPSLWKDKAPCFKMENMYFRATRSCEHLGDIQMVKFYFFPGGAIHMYLLCAWRSHFRWRASLLNNKLTAIKVSMLGLARLECMSWQELAEEAIHSITPVSNIWKKTKIQPTGWLASHSISPFLQNQALILSYLLGPAAALGHMAPHQMAVSDFQVTPYAHQKWPAIMTAIISMDFYHCLLF